MNVPEPDIAGRSDASGRPVTAATEVHRLGADPDRGLTSAEAQRRLVRDGPNSLPEQETPSALAILLRQFDDPLVLLLIGAAVTSFALGELLDGAVIGAIVLMNASLGAFQEGRAESAARAVRALLAPTAIAVRDSTVRQLDAASLVEGDVVLISAGDRVPADGLLLEATRLEVDESSMTGESMPAGKRAGGEVGAGEVPLAERANSLLSGTTATRGEARLLVTATGPRTELARIAEQAGGPSPEGPLQQRLASLAAFLLKAAGVICVGLMGLSLLHGESLGDSLLVGISLAVAAVPEGLAAVVTITLALGMHRLAQRGAIVRRLRAVETLGSASVICTDKTGTLTTNRMTVARLRPVGGAGAAGERELLAAALIASSDAHDPGEEAISDAAGLRGLHRAGVLEDLRMVGGEPFDSERKRMSVVVEAPGGGRTAYVKGAPEVLAPRVSAGGDTQPLLADARAWARDAIRVMMVARRGKLGTTGDPERELEPLGLIGLIDPLRETARDSVLRAKAAGVRTIMVTGDHPQTAVAIARACLIGADHNGERRGAVTGPELDHLSDAALREAVKRTDVFARVAPEHKSRIVSALRANGEVVAVTGDGVNDAPALSDAEIGIAMGSGGSDAAIEAADVVLTDNDFSTIVAAIEGGRRIYDNIVRFVSFLLAANAGEVLLFALAVTPGLGIPLTVAQILMVNLLTDGLPAVALGVDPADERTMTRPPRPRTQGVLEPIRGRLVVGGLATGLAAFAAFLIGDRSSLELAQTMAFTTVVFAQLGFVYAVRGDLPFWRAGRNPLLHASVAISALAAAMVLALPPLRDAFSTVPLSAGQLAAALALASAPLLATEVLKLLARRERPPC